MSNQQNQITFCIQKPSHHSRRISKLSIPRTSIRFVYEKLLSPVISSKMKMMVALILCECYQRGAYRFAARYLLQRIIKISRAMTYRLVYRHRNKLFTPPSALTSTHTHVYNSVYVHTGRAGKMFFLLSEWQRWETSAETRAYSGEMQLLSFINNANTTELSLSPFELFVS